MESFLQFCEFCENALIILQLPITDYSSTFVVVP